MTLTGSQVQSALTTDAIAFRQFVGSLVPRQGVGGAGDMKVRPRGTPGQGVLVSAGTIYLLGSSSSVQGVYSEFNDADVDVAASAADGAQTRIDRLIYRVRDADYPGGSPPSTLEWLQGTAGSGLAPTVPV